MSTESVSPQKFQIDTQRGLYPIVYVRGFAPSAVGREGTFYDAYYGYAETAVEKRDAPPPQFLEPMIFEGQVIRFMKEYGYVDTTNGGLTLALRDAVNSTRNPAQSLWISRFYDRDVVFGQARSIEEHAEDLYQLICETIPKQFKQFNISLGENDQDYKVILIAHSMGGLVCRCLIQNILPGRNQDPKRWLHRFVTIASPHKGIELGAIPDFLEQLVIGQGNALNAAIFREERMREYLNLSNVGTDGKLPELHSLNGKFPEGRCFCVIGSDHESYNITKKATGSHSDGLVKQDRAYIKGAYWANVHRAHSGRRGIVNSFETYENIRRFLFGDTRVKIWLENVTIEMAPPSENIQEFYDFEFSLSVRGTGIFLHQRKQVPCENAQRFMRAALDKASIHLHTAFMDSQLRSPGAKFSHFLLELRVVRHQIEAGFLFDHQYPERDIYNESLEVRVDLTSENMVETPTLQYRWLSDAAMLDDEASWQPATFKAGIFQLPFRKTKLITGKLCLQPSRWPDATVDSTQIDAARS